jgi:hypothetical protein
MTVQELHEMTRVLIERGHADTQVYTQRKRNGKMYCVNFTPELSGVKISKAGILRDINGIKAIIG